MWEAEERRDVARGEYVSRASAGLLTTYNELASLIALIAVGSVIAAIKFEAVSQASSLEWDSASFLTNGAVYAGYSQYGHALDPTRPPMIPFILSILFRITGPQQLDGYILSAVLYVLAMAGCFLIAKEMMNPYLAVVASLSFGLAPYVFEWSGIMLSDVEGVGIAALALALTIIATKRNKRLLLVALPLLVLAPLTRYSLGIVIVAAIVYLVAAGKNDWILDNYEFYYGVGLALLVFFVFGGQWLSYPFLHHTTISVLFPTPAQVNPFHSTFGQLFYLVNLPEELGRSYYGYLLATLFTLTTLYVISAKITRIRSQSVDPIAISLLAWVVLMLLYYSLAWPYSDLRYSVEFVMPVILLAYYGVSLMVRKVDGFIATHLSGNARVALSLLVLALFVFSTAFAMFPSGSAVVTKTQTLEVGLNSGLKQASSWLALNASPSARIQSNWYTLMWWYSPRFNVTAAPLDYQLAQPGAYSSWQSMIFSNRITYVVYVDPTKQLEGEMPMLSSVQNYTSDGSQVVVFKVGP